MNADAPRRMGYCWETALRRRCRPADPSDPGLEDLVRDMRRLLREHDGVGLAAPQAGDDRRVILVRKPEDPPERVRVLVNPEILETSDDRVPFLEGCLSFPDVYRTVHRPSRIKARAVGLDGRPQELDADGILARVIQHEVDHLDGILFVDHLSIWERFRVRFRMQLWRLGWR